MGIVYLKLIGVEFYGFKWHLIVDDQGQWVSFFVTPGNIDERQGLIKMAKFIKGKSFGDKDYIPKALAQALWEKGAQLVIEHYKMIKGYSGKSLLKPML